jgi:hypothetical protein
MRLTGQPRKFSRMLDRLTGNPGQSEVLCNKFSKFRWSVTLAVRLPRRHQRRIYGRHAVAKPESANCISGNPIEEICHLRGVAKSTGGQGGPADPVVRALRYESTASRAATKTLDIIAIMQSPKYLHYLSHQGVIVSIQVLKRRLSNLKFISTGGTDLVDRKGLGLAC